MTAPIGERSVTLGETRHLHPATLLLGLTRIGPGMVNFLPALVGIGVTGQWWLIVPALLLFIIISMLFVWLAWARFTWRVDADSIAIASGVFSRTQRTIPLDRIQDVSIEQGLVARLLGVAVVGFETGAAAGNNKQDDGKLNAIALDEAHMLRDHIRTHRSAVAMPPIEGGRAASSSSGAAPPLYAMTPRRLVIAGLFNFSLAVLGLLFGSIQTFDNFLPFNPFDFDFWREMARGTRLESWILLHRWIAAIGSVIVLVLLGMATGLIRTAVKEWGFTLERTPRGLRRTRGLTTRTDVTIPLARVQAAIVGTGLLRRGYGWYDLRLQSLAGDGKNEPDHMVAPLARLDEVDAILREAGLDRADYEGGHSDSAWHGSHPVGIIIVPAILSGASVIAFAVLSTFASDYLWAISFPLLSIPFMAVIGWLDWRRRRWHFDGRLLHITKGVLRRRHIILPARNVQSADLSVGPIERQLGLASLILGVPGGKEGQHEVAAIPRGDAAALRQELLAAR